MIKDHKFELSCCTKPELELRTFGFQNTCLCGFLNLFFQRNLWKRTWSLDRYVRPFYLLVEKVLFFIRRSRLRFSSNVIFFVELMLYISTSNWVLRTPNAGWNSHFLRFWNSQPAFWCKFKKCVFCKILLQISCFF